MPRTRIVVIVLGAALSLYPASVLWEVVARAVSSGEILVHPALRQRPRLPPTPYPWQQAWTIILGWLLVTASGVVLSLAAALRSEIAALCVPALLLLGFVCIAGATVISSFSGALVYLVAVGLGVAVMSGIAILSERLERWKAERRINARR